MVKNLRYYLMTLLMAMSAVAVAQIPEGVEFAKVTANPANGAEVKAPVMSIAVTYEDAALLMVNPNSSDYVQLVDESGALLGVLPMIKLGINGNVLTITNQSMQGSAPIFDNEGNYNLYIPASKILAGADSASLAPAGGVKLSYKVLAPDPEKEITFVATPESGSVVDALPYVEIEFPGWGIAGTNPEYAQRFAVGITKDGVQGDPLGIDVVAFPDDKLNAVWVNTNLTEPGEYMISIFPNVFAVGDEGVAEKPYAQPIVLNYTIEAVAEELDTVITYPGNGETFTLGRYDRLSVWFNTYLSGSLNAENTEPVMIFDSEDNMEPLEGVKFVSASSPMKGFIYDLVKEDGSSLFHEVGSFTIEIPAGKFMVTDSANVTAPSKKIKVSYTVAPVLGKAVVANPADGAKVDALDMLTLTFQGYGYMALDAMVDFMSDPMNIVINKDGVFYKNFTGANFGEYSIDDSGVDAIITLKKLGLKEAGVYTLEFPAGKFNDFMLENPSPAFSLTYTVDPAVGINDVVAGEVADTEYFSVSGAALNAPVKGVNIVKQTLTNGTVVTSKVLVK